MYFILTKCLLCTYTIHMKQVPMTIKIDSEVKSDAQKVAKSLGLSMSAIIENKLREVVRERRVVFEEDTTPNAKTAKLFAEIEEDAKAGRNMSKPFNTYEELEEHLNSL